MFLLQILPSSDQVEAASQNPVIYMMLLLVLAVAALFVIWRKDTREANAKTMELQLKMVEQMTANTAATASLTKSIETLEATQSLRFQELKQYLFEKHTEQQANHTKTQQRIDDIYTFITSQK
ncbi:MAG: hypothetical protein AAFO96_03765 [Bacteroidota bacterium]